MQLVKDSHYVICLDLKFQQRYIVWISDEIDEVLVNDDLKVIAFKTKDEMLKYWHENIRECNIDITNYDLNLLQQWLLYPVPEFDRVLFLNLWNLFIDVAESVKQHFIGDDKEDVRNTVYDKLFDASGIFIADEPNPDFDHREIDVLSKIMQNGLDILLNNITVIGE